MVGWSFGCWGVLQLLGWMILLVGTLCHPKILQILFSDAVNNLLLLKTILRGNHFRLWRLNQLKQSVNILILWKTTSGHIFLTACYRFSCFTFTTLVQILRWFWWVLDWFFRDRMLVRIFVSWYCFVWWSSFLMGWGLALVVVLFKAYDGGLTLFSFLCV